MASRAEICSFHGASPTPTIVTEVRFKRADNDTLDTLNPIPISTTLDTWSWRKHFMVRWTALPVTQIENLIIFADEPLHTDDNEDTAWDEVALYIGTTAVYFQASVADEAGLVNPIAGEAMKDVDFGRAGDETAVDVYSPMSNRVGIPNYVLRSTKVTVPTFGEDGLQFYALMQMKINKDTKPGVKVERNVWFRWTEW